MSQRKHNSKMDILSYIPYHIIALFFKLFVILSILNLISVLFSLFFTKNATIALISFFISSLLVVFSYFILKKKAKDSPIQRDAIDAKKV